MSNTLRTINVLCIIAHGAFCTIWIKKKKDNYIIPADLKVYSTSLQNINGYVTNTLVEKPNSIFKTDLRDLLISFFAITCAVHSFYFVSSFDKVPLIGGFYNKMILNKNNFIRWIEYSITATLMINIIARSVGVSNEDTLLLTNLATVTVMLQGQSTELALQEKPSKKKVIKLITYNVIGWGLLMGVFGIIISRFEQTIEDIKKATCANIPNFVKYVIWTQVLFYSAFGIWQLYQIFNVYQNPDYNYEKFEIGYNVLSLLSKTTLGAILGFGIDQSANRDVNKKYKQDCT